MSTYILDQTWELEEQRLAHLEGWSDPISFDVLTRLGVSSGWNCLEVGAGRGSVAAWLADRAGPEGRALAVDLDLTLLERNRRPNLQLLKADILQDDLPENDFDLVHARHLVGWLGDRRRELIGRLASVLKPGGVIVVEDNDMIWNDLGHWPSDDPELSELLLKVWTGLMRLWAQAGYDGRSGRELGANLRAAGLAGVGGEARLTIGGEHGAPLSKLSALRFREPLVQTGALTDQEFDRFLERMEAADADFPVYSPLLVSAWGRRPLG